MSSVHSLTDLYAGSREQQVYETREKNRRIYNVYSLGVHFPYLFFIFFFFLCKLENKSFTKGGEGLSYLWEEGAKGKPAGGESYIKVFKITRPFLLAF